MENNDTNTSKNLSTGKSAAALREEAVLKLWEEQNIFQKTLEKVSPKGEFVFFEGPPTANGKPGIHHLEGRAFKDAIPRYRTMRGYHVRRKGGWDTHGLPVELQVEKKLGLKSKKDIETYGIAKFNQECKESVWEYRDLWEKFTTRIGYWVDQENPYVTYHNNYIESVWNVLAEVEKKDLLYKDYRIVPWCPRCGTALSSHELAQGYEDVKDLSVTAKFKLDADSTRKLCGPDAENVYLLAWTTTPWTLPGNVALAIGADIIYVEAKVGDEIFVLAKDLLSKITEPYEIIAEHKGSEMVGMSYEPLYPFLKDNLPESEKVKLDKAFKVHLADFVTTTDGTGIVHTAVMYGQDDFELGTKIGLPKFHIVNDEGMFKPELGFLAGRFVKDEDVAVDIIKDLAGRGLLFKKEKYEHSYPHCWRCKTPLIYYARDSWYIRMSSPEIKNALIEENKSINWEPSHVREGRFGEWLKDLKDWAISRERYWGTPLPIWQCGSCDKRHVVSSIDDLKSRSVSSGNSYILMRHGESEYNIKQLVSADRDGVDPLTEKGREQARVSAEKLKDTGIDIIIASPFVRARETAAIVAETIGIDPAAIIYDEGFAEMRPGDFGGTTWLEYHSKMPKIAGNFTVAFSNGESYQSVKERAMQALERLEKTYSGKKILIVTHGAPSWLMLAGSYGYTVEETLAMVRNKEQFHYLQNAEFHPFTYAPLPHNAQFELDLHRPYIDEITLRCDCSGEMTRTKEVMDVWFDSGAMPLAQDHYPFENKEWVDGAGYPADYIAEGLDQTRGWFYTLLAVAVLLGRKAPYKNVICLGLILDAHGKKMSKSIGNVVDPITMIDKYGVDTLRLWMYSVNQPGDSKNFDEKTVAELHNKVFNLLYNVVTFYELYRDRELEAQSNVTGQSSHVLDRWIMARLGELTENVTRDMDAFKLFDPVREIRAFIDDLSTWYVRRSRDRMKDGEKEAKQTLYFVLKDLIKLMAPFAPFAAEDLWQKLKNESDVESVHLTAWPEANGFSEEEINLMKEVRVVVSSGLEARQKSGIKVRQPLASITIAVDLGEAYKDILRDELNVKQILFVKDAAVSLDTVITPELKTEGDFRELVRAIQDMRKKADLSLSDEITLTIETDETGKELIGKFEAELRKAVLAKAVTLASNDGIEVTIDSLAFKIALQ